MFLSAFRKVLHRRAEPAPTLPGPTSARARRRRGATAMEYLAVISFIFIVAISAINYFGQSTKEKSQQNGDAIEKATGGQDKDKSGP